jgi:hypothetical protein
MATSKAIKAKLEKLSAKIKTRQAELATFRDQAKSLKTDLATARATEQAKKAAKG